MPRSSTIIKQYNTPSKVPGVLTPTELLTNGNFEDWQTNLFPDDFFIEAPGDGVPLEPYFSRSTDSNTGTYALDIVTGYSDEGDYLSDFFEQEVTSFAAGNTMQVKYYSKGVSGTPEFGVAYLYYDSNADIDYVYNFTTTTWVDESTDPSEDDIYYWVTPGGSYAQTTVPSATLPGSNVDEVFVGMLGFSTAGTDEFLVDDLEILIQGVDQASNGTFESWSEYADQSDPIDNWTFVPGDNWDLSPADDESSKIVREETNIQGGTYATRLDVESKESGDSGRGYIYQSYSGAVDTVTVPDFYYRANDVLSSYVVFVDGTPGLHTRAWNFSTKNWDLDATDVRSYPGGNYADTLTNSTSYQQYNAAEDEIEIPNSGTITMILMTETGQGPADTIDNYYFDTASLIGDVIVGGSQFDGLSAASETDSTDLTATDNLIKIEGKDGEKLFNIDAIGVVTTSAESLDFTSEVLEVADPTEDDHPMNLSSYNNSTPTIVKTTAMSKLATVPVDYKTVGQTDLYIVPTGFRLVGMRVLVETYMVDAPNNDSSATMGTSAGSWTDVTSTVPQPSGNQAEFRSAEITTTTAISAGESIKVNVSSADTGTDLDAYVTLYGVLEFI